MTTGTTSRASIIATPSASSVKPAANGTKRERKLDDEDLARLRHLYEEGVDSRRAG